VSENAIEPTAKRPAVGELDRRTIRDFGEQWQAFRANEGYYGSLGLFADILGPLLGPRAVRGCRVADVGSGTGRIVKMLLEAGAGHVTAVEPSPCFDVLKRNVAGDADRVECLNVTGDRLPAQGDLDYVFSIGVLHHIPDPAPTVKAAFSALRPGGRIVVWLYGREGNELYLALAGRLRALTTRLPHRILWALSWSLVLPLSLYISACRVLPLPMRDYMVHHLGRLSRKNILVTVYDQLNPTYARYYRKEEVRELLEGAGFEEVRLYHRHNYSWTAVGTRPRRDRDHGLQEACDGSSERHHTCV